MKERNLETYKLDRVTPEGREFLGVVHYTEHIKKHKKKNPNGLHFNPQKALRNWSIAAVATGIIVGGTAVGFKLGPAAYDGASSFVSETVETVKSEFASLKSVAFTNYSDAEINKMDFDEKINLLENYLNYMGTISLPAQYQQQGLPEDLNYSKVYAEAISSYQEYYQYSSSFLTDEKKQVEQDKVLGKFYDAINIINRLYNGKYKLNVENPGEDYNLINDVHQNTQTNSNTNNMVL